MESTYLVELIKMLSPAKREELLLFVQSPYHNRSIHEKDLQVLLRVILAAAPEFSAESLAKEKVYDQVFSGQSFVKGKLEKLMVELNKLIRSFLLIEHYSRETNEFQQTLDLAGLLRRGGQELRYQQTLAHAAKLLDSEPWEAPERFYRRFQLAYETHDWLSLTNHAKGELNIPEVIRNLDIFFLSCRLDLQNRFFSQQHQTALASSEEVLVDTVALPLMKIYEEGSPLLRITAAINRVLGKAVPDPSLFQHLLDLLLLYGQQLQPETLRRFYTYLRIYCVFLINVGYREFIGALHQLHQDNLQRGYFYYEGKISHSAYLNVVAIALRAAQIEWAKGFVEDHKHMILGETESSDTYHLTLAICLFAERKFQEALDILPIKPDYSVAHLMARRLELKVFYELKSDLLPYKLDAFKMYINRASPQLLPQNLRDLHANFVNILYQLFQSTPGDKARSERLLKRIREKKSAAEWDWLLEKAREIGGS